jgi:hypothetical protein
MALFRKKWWRWVVPVFLAVIVWRWLPLRPLPAHTGDGEFADITVRGRLFPGGPSLYDFHGYSVTFPSFDMTADHCAEYRVSRLPEIGLDCRLYLGIDDPGLKWWARDEEQRQLRAWLRLEVVDEKGEVIHQGEGRLGKWQWGMWDWQHRLYPKDAPFRLSFRPAHHQTYLFRMKYTGDEALAGRRGYCYLQCGPMR